MSGEPSGAETPSGEALDRSSVTPWVLPPLEYLLECSEMALRDLELYALSRAAGCLKRSKLEWEEAVAQREAAGVARWLIENRPKLLEQASRTVQISPALSVTVTGPKKGLDALLGTPTPQPKPQKQGDKGGA